MDLKRWLSVTEEHLSALADVVKAYRGTDQTNAFVKLLECLADCYRSDLMSCDPDQLRGRQAALKQVLALRDVAMGGEYATPRI